MLTASSATSASSKASTDDRGCPAPLERAILLAGGPWPRRKPLTTSRMRTTLGLMHSALAVPGDADVAQTRSRLAPTENAGPSASGVSRVIVRSVDVATLLVGLTRYTTGLQIDLAVRCRIDPDLGDRMHSTVDAGPFAGGHLVAGRLAAVAGRDTWSNGPAADQQVLTHWGGDRKWSSTLWSTPAPPPGDPVLVVADPASAWTSRVSPWMPKGFELRSRRSRSRGRASLIRRIRPVSRRSTYRPGTGSHGHFRR